MTPTGRDRRPLPPAPRRATTAAARSTNRSSAPGCWSPPATRTASARRTSGRSLPLNIGRQTSAAWWPTCRSRSNGAGVPLQLLPGGEINLREDTPWTRPGVRSSPTAWRGQFVLIDLWAEKLPPFFDPTVRWFQGHGVKVDPRPPRADAGGAARPAAGRPLRRDRPAAPGQPPMLRRPARHADAPRRGAVPAARVATSCSAATCTTSRRCRCGSRG